MPQNVHKPKLKSKSKTKAKANQKPQSENKSKLQKSRSNPTTSSPLKSSNLSQSTSPTLKNYFDMALSDLSLRPFMWHFSSYGLTLNATQSLPLPHFCTTELSVEELRLQVYAEAAATSGRIENYVRVVEGIKNRAEGAVRELIPNLENVIRELLVSNGVNFVDENDNFRLNSYTQEAQTQAQTHVPLINHSQLQAQAQTHVPLINHSQLQAQLQLQAHSQSQSQSQSQSHSQSQQDIPFVFGQIPEMAPE